MERACICLIALRPNGKQVKPYGTGDRYTEHLLGSISVARTRCKRERCLREHPNAETRVISQPQETSRILMVGRPWQFRYHRDVGREALEPSELCGWGATTTVPSDKPQGGHLSVAVG